VRGREGESPANSQRPASLSRRRSQVDRKGKEGTKSTGLPRPSLPDGRLLRGGVGSWVARRGQNWEAPLFKEMSRSSLPFR